jgi:hypothetical protein
VTTWCRARQAVDEDGKKRDFGYLSELPRTLSTLTSSDKRWSCFTGSLYGDRNRDFAVNEDTSDDLFSRDELGLQACGSRARSGIKRYSLFFEHSLARRWEGPEG